MDVPRQMDRKILISIGLDVTMSKFTHPWQTQNAALCTKMVGVHCRACETDGTLVHHTLHQSPCHTRAPTMGGSPLRVRRWDPCHHRARDHTHGYRCPPCRGVGWRTAPLGQTTVPKCTPGSKEKYANASNVSANGHLTPVLLCTGGHLMQNRPTLWGI